MAWSHGPLVQVGWSAGISALAWSLASKVCFYLEKIKFKHIYSDFGIIYEYDLEQMTIFIESQKKLSWIVSLFSSSWAVHDIKLFHEFKN